MTHTGCSKDEIDFILAVLGVVLEERGAGRNRLSTILPAPRGELLWLADAFAAIFREVGDEAVHCRIVGAVDEGAVLALLLNKPSLPELA